MRSCPFIRPIELCLATILLGSFFLITQQVESKTSASPPNIIIILSDDAGYADFGCFGDETFPTPAIDKLAREGIRFNQAYVTASICGPSRAGLMTGRYQQRFGYIDNPPHHPPEYLKKDLIGLPLDEVTIGQVMKNAGYYTGYIGKWHLGEGREYHPCNRGFDEYFGFKRGFHTYYPDELIDKRDPILRNFDSAEEQPYLTDAFGEEAISFISRKKDEPFFLFLSFNAVHTPMQAKEEYISKIRKSHENADEGRITLMAMAHAMDVQVGRIMERLEALSLDRKTCVIFLNDNGGAVRNHSVNKPLRGHKNTMWEGGLRVPMIMWWPESLEAGTKFDGIVSTLDILPTITLIGGVCLDPDIEFDGTDLMPYLEGINQGSPHSTLYWKRWDYAAIRNDNWKMIRFPDMPAQLFNLDKDISESVDLSNKHPEVLKDLFKKLHFWEEKMEKPMWFYNRLQQDDSVDPG